MKMLDRKHSRTTNSAYNFATSMGGQFLTILMQFIVRTVFIHTIGKTYLGIGGLFSNILSMLSLTEFGVGSAIIFKLYDPIARNDHHRIAILMHFYKNVYRIIGLVVALLGIALIPFLHLFIKDFDKLKQLNLNTTVIFLLYLAKTVSSYVFFAYKSAIIKANQKEYLINLISYFFTIGGAVIQIIVLLVYSKFELYVLISVIQVLAQNVVIAVLANKMYPYITEQPSEQIKKDEVKDIIKDCGALILYKLNVVVLKATDNIVISTFIGLDMVGMYSNYSILYTAINSLFSKIFGSVSHSLGNLHTKSSVKHEYEVFESVNLITAILGGTAFAGIIVVADEFVFLWIGAEWQIAQPFSFLMGFELYTLASRAALGKYRTAMGLFQQAKWRPLAGMIINLVVSIALVKLWGICGVLVGTLVADWLTIMWYDPMIIHKYGFKNYKPVIEYFKRLALYTVTVLCVGAADYFVCKHIFAGKGWYSVIIHALICVVTMPSALIFLRRNTQEGKYVIGMIRKTFNRGKKRLKKVIGKKIN